MAKQPVKKKVLNMDFINSFKESIKGNVAYKPVSFIEMPEGFQKALRLPGIPEGQLTIVHGHSNTGKSSLVNGAIVGAQKRGILPIIIDTENNFSFQYAKKFGMIAEPIMGKVTKEIVDTTTGEVTEVEEDGIVDWEGPFVFINHSALLKKYGNMDYSTGKPGKNRRALPCIEDVALCIKEFLDAQRDGILDFDLLFIWDSVGSIHSFDSLMSNNQQNMRNANKLKEAFSTIVPRITATRDRSFSHQNTMLVVNKVWNDNMSMGMPTQELWGGEGLKYLSRLCIQVGGVTKASIKRLNATSKGQLFNYGIQTKIKVTKNQLDAPYQISLDGNMCCVMDSIISPDDIDEWKKSHIKEINEILSNDAGVQIDDSDIAFEEVESED